MQNLKLVKKVNPLVGVYKDENEKYYKLDFSKDEVPFVPTEAVNEEKIGKYRLSSYTQESLEKIVKEKVEIEKEKIKKALEIEDEVDFKRVFLYENPVQLRSEIERDFETFFLPHELNFYVDIYGRSGWSAKIYLENAIVDAWGIEHNEDSETVARGNLAGYLGDGEVAIEIPQVIKKPTYYNIDSESTKILEKILDRFVEIDVNDARGHLLGAWVTIGLNENSPDEEWNSLVRKANQKLRKYEEKNRIDTHLKMKEKVDKWIEKNEKEIERLNIKDKIEILYDKFLQEKGISDYYLNEMKKIIEEEVKEDNNRKYYKNLIENIKKNKELLFSADFKHSDPIKIYYKDFQIKRKIAFISVPKNLIGAFIGKGGSGIKTYKKILNVRKIIINELPPVNDTVKHIFRRDIPEKYMT